MQKRILVAPLNWGLGHATRCVPVIEELMQQEASVLLAANGQAGEFLKQTFPKLPYYNLPGFDIQYQKTDSFNSNFIRQLPGLFRSVQTEHTECMKLISTYSIDAVISDNRYGLWHPQKPCVLVTHQLNLQGKGLQKIMVPAANALIQHYIRKFSFCWIPDYPAMPGLAGKLSHKAKQLANQRFTGPLSRFSVTPENATETEYDLIAILSGPEPQRSIFEQLIIEQARLVKHKIVVVRGLPGHSDLPAKGKNLLIFNHLPADEMKKYIARSRNIICRSGYSGIMDLNALGRHAFLVPTPGQPEQEYLAEIHNQSGRFTHVNQNDINLEMIFKNTQTSFETPKLSSDLLKTAVNEFLGAI